MTRLRNAWKAVMDPLVTDRRYDVASMLTWLFYALWGLLSAFSALTVFQTYDQWEEVYPQLWGGAVGLFALFAAVCAASTFFLQQTDFKARIRCKRGEMFALFGTIGLIAVYPVTLIVQGDAQGNFRPDIIALSLSYFPHLIFRILHLRTRVEHLYLIAGV